MFTIVLKIKRKIKRLLKAQTESRQRTELTRKKHLYKVLLIVVASIFFGLIFSGEVLYDPLNMPLEGEFAPEDIIAPYQITLYKDEREIRDEEEMIHFSIAYVLDYDSSIVTSVYKALDNFAEQVETGRRAIARDSTQLVLIIDSLSSKFPIFSKTAIEKVVSGDDKPSDIVTLLKQIYASDLYSNGILQTVNNLPEQRIRSMSIRRENSESVVQRSKLLDMNLAKARLLTVLNEIADKDSIDVETFYLIGRTFIQPNLWPNKGEYDRRINEEIEQISHVKEIINSGDIIVSARKKVTERQSDILQEMAKLKRSQSAGENYLNIFLPVVARILLILAAFIALYIFLYSFRRQIYNSNPKLVAILMVFALQLTLISLVERLGFDSIYVFPIAVLPILITVLFDAEVGILNTIILAVLLGVLHRFSFTIAFMTIVVGTVACFSSQRVRKRSDFYRIMMFVILSYVTFIFIVENLKLSPNTDILNEAILGLASGLVSVMLTIGILPLFESLFGITSDITLLELSDLNHPLLKRLAIEAPGTYHHSIIVGNLTESAAKAIGANSLLARVGAYYHDIGKIEIPEYFVENQLSVKSKHEELTPSMSSIILSSHVKKGRAIGEEADIPDDVLNFIEEHHGTMVMTYFYNKAKEQGIKDISIDKFRYPGPKPQTRETGIAMLADAVEAASRTLDEPKPARIDNLIQRIINDRFQSGELDECPLTLKDLAQIKSAFAQILIAAFHHRVKYPAADTAEVR